MFEMFELVELVEMVEIVEMVEMLKWLKCLKVEIAEIVDAIEIFAMDEMVVIVEIIEIGWGAGGVVRGGGWLSPIIFDVTKLQSMVRDVLDKSFQASVLAEINYHGWVGGGRWCRWWVATVTFFGLNAK